MDIKSINTDRPLDDKTLRQLSDTELLELRSLLQDEADRIKRQLGEARSRVFTHREYADPNWFHRAEQASRGKGTNMLRIQTEQARRKTERKQSVKQKSNENRDSFGFRLLKAMDVLLPPDLKRQVVNLAIELEK